MTVRVDHAERYVDEWREACRIESITGPDSRELRQMADWLVKRMRPIFDTVEELPVAGHAPIVVGELKGTGSSRLLIYTHYDVVPPGENASWRSPPFSAALDSGAVWARGCCDDKADVVARLQALELWLASLRGRPPYTILWLCEGAEEIGSPGLDEVLSANAARLSAPECLWESFLRRGDDRPEIAFGCRGMLSVRLSCRLLRADQHVAFAPVLRSSAREVARALASLTDEHGDVALDGFLDRAIPLSSDELAAAQAPFLRSKEIGAPDVFPYLVDDDGELCVRLNSTPMANISEITAGDGTGDAAVIPAAASARVDFSLVPDQEPADIAAKLRRHLDALGLTDVTIENHQMLRPAKGSIETPLAKAAIQAAADIYGDPVIYPLLPGAGPGRVLLDRLGATIVSPAGTTRLTSGIHAADEHGAVSDYIDHIRFSLRTFERFAETACN